MFMAFTSSWRAAVGSCARGVDLRQLPQRLDRDGIARGSALGVGERGRGVAVAIAVIAALKSFSEWSGCHTNQAATIVAATMPRPAAATPGEVPRRRRSAGSSDRLVQRSAAGEPAGAHERWHGEAGDEPGPVDQRGDAERHDDG